MPDEDFNLDVGEMEYKGSNVDDDRTEEGISPGSPVAGVMPRPWERVDVEWTPHLFRVESGLVRMVWWNWAEGCWRASVAGTLLSGKFDTPQEAAETSDKESRKKLGAA